MLIIAVFIYAAAMTAANLSIAAFGPKIAPINAFVLIGLDLTLRDWLHLRLSKMQLGCLVVVTSLLTFALNPAAGAIAVASASAFGAAAIVDWVVFSKLRGSWLFRANGSNAVAAVVDSLLFLALAPFPFNAAIAMQMSAAKIAGGGVWSWALSRFAR